MERSPRDRGARYRSALAAAPLLPALDQALVGAPAVARPFTARPSDRHARTLLPSDRSPCTTSFLGAPAGPLAREGRRPDPWTPDKSTGDKSSRTPADAVFDEGQELELGRSHLPTTLDNAFTLIRERATRHGITLTQTVEERVGDIVADERKVKQILLNLAAFDGNVGRRAAHRGQARLDRAINEAAGDLVRSLETRLKDQQRRRSGHWPMSR
jgi:hypothetical protein